MCNEKLLLCFGQIESENNFHFGDDTVAPFPLSVSDRNSLSVYRGSYGTSRDLCSVSLLMFRWMVVLGAIGSRHNGKTPKEAGCVMQM
jgi:hypothetical protein